MLIKVVLIDDNKTLCDTLAHELEELEEFQVVNLAYDAESGLKAIHASEPDVVILDLVMPHGDGRHILEQLRENPMDNNPAVIILSALGEDNNIREVIELGAYCYLMKPFSMKVLAKRIRQAYLDKIKNCENIAVDGYRYQEKYASFLLNNLGVSAKLKGFLYLKRALVMLSESANETEGLTKWLYPTLAKEYKTNPSNVERNIRHAISVAWDNDMQVKYKKHLKQDISNKPANSEFIHSLAEYLRNSSPV